MSESEWPEYEVGASKEHIYAVGVLIANWADVENQMYWVLYHLMKSPETSHMMFHNMNNSERFGALKALAADKLDDEDKDLVDTFVTHAKLCNQNRNILAHAKFLTVGSDKMLAEKSTKNGKGSSLYNFTLKNLQVAADETMNTFRFGRRLRFWLGAQTHDDKDKNIRYQVNMHPLLVKEVPDPEKRTHTVRRPVIPAKPTTLSPEP